MKRFWKKEKQPQRPERRRLVLLRALMTASVFILLVRFSYVQIWHRQPWLKLTDELYKSRVQLTAKRGEIFDRKQNVLAADISSVALSADPTKVKGFSRTAAKLAAILGGQKEEYLQLLKHPVSPKYTRIRKSITEPQNRALQKARIEGLIFIDGQMRIHPFADLGLQVLGITDADHSGVGGIEQFFETVLSGQDGWAYLQRDALNRRFTSADYPKEKPLDGEKLVLTLDYNLQAILEEELRAGMNRHQAQGASGVLMDPYTGEVLAMASVSQGAEKDPALAIQNQAVQASFEPGSSFKIVTVAAALEEKVVEPQTLIHCENGAYVRRARPYTTTTNPTDCSRSRRSWNSPRTSASSRSGENWERRSSTSTSGASASVTAPGSNCPAKPRVFASLITAGMISRQPRFPSGRVFPSRPFRWPAWFPSSPTAGNW